MQDVGIVSRTTATAMTTHLPGTPAVVLRARDIVRRSRGFLFRRLGLAGGMSWGLGFLTSLRSAGGLGVVVGVFAFLVAFLIVILTHEGRPELLDARAVLEAWEVRREAWALQVVQAATCIDIAEETRAFEQAQRELRPLLESARR